jgi:phenylacetyl-CoA:acceptor oxidoreductase subunit 1
MTKWGMVIDLKKCVDCQTCTVACKVENFLPPGVQWNRVYDYEVGEYPNITRRFLPVPCMHCDDPPCAEVCPTGATKKRSDGIVYVEYEKCLGCKYCDVACPYRARAFLDHTEYYYGQPTEYETFPYELRSPAQRYLPGTATKCTFCVHRIDYGLANGLKVGQDPEATPACVVSCIAKARYFGDLDDPHSEVSRLIRERKAFRLLEHLGTGPSVYYLAP